jgi:hypothetical protein
MASKASATAKASGKLAPTEAQAVARGKATAPTGKPATKTTKARKPWKACAA